MAHEYEERKLVDGICDRGIIKLINRYEITMDSHFLLYLIMIIISDWPKTPE